MKIGLLTTLDTNIGDDFIREGIIHALKQTFPNKSLEFVKVNKHKPHTLYPSWHPVYLSESFPKGRCRLRRIFSRLTSWAGHSVFEHCDLIVQCGAPVYWYGCHRAEWVDVFWKGIVRHLSGKTPVLNLAAGSCYPWEKIPKQISDRDDASYMKEIYDVCALTVVRDKCSERLLKQLGCEPLLIPCSAMLASMPYQNNEQTQEYVFINYMPGGSHYDFEQGIDHKKWDRTMKEFINTAKLDNNLAFICHNQKEYDAAKKMDPEIKCFFPKTIKEYFKVASLGKVGIFNRMHATVGFAGLGIPSIAIGADTRMMMVENTGLPFRYVKDVTCNVLMDTLENLLATRDEEHTRLLALQKKTLASYVEKIREAIR